MTRTIIALLLVALSALTMACGPEYPERTDQTYQTEARPDNCFQDDKTTFTLPAYSEDCRYFEDGAMCHDNFASITFLPEQLLITEMVYLPNDGWCVNQFDIVGINGLAQGN